MMKCFEYVFYPTFNRIRGNCPKFFGITKIFAKIFWIADYFE